MVRVRLTDEQVKARAEDLASFIKKQEEIEGKKAAAVAKFNGELKLIADKISQLADEVDTHEANVEAQTAMDYGGVAGRRKKGDEAAPAPAPAPVPEGTSDVGRQMLDIAERGKAAAANEGAAEGAA